jgi:hypothetical protein
MPDRASPPAHHRQRRPHPPTPARYRVTRRRASWAEPPCAAGSVSGPMTPSSSMTEPGQPCVMISGSAFSCRDLTWMKWMSTPSMCLRDRNRDVRHAPRRHRVPRRDGPGAPGHPRRIYTQSHIDYVIEVAARAASRAAKLPACAWSPSPGSYGTSPPGSRRFTDRGDSSTAPDPPEIGNRDLSIRCDCAGPRGARKEVAIWSATWSPR